VKSLLSLLQGPSAAVAAKWFWFIIMPGKQTVMGWLAMQPGAAAELGLTAADVPGRVAAVLLFGDQAAGVADCHARMEDDDSEDDDDDCDDDDYGSDDLSELDC
jgi:hypothetical protein